MRTHILLTIVALIFTACASKENVSQAKLDQQDRQQEEFTQREFDSASRFR